MQILNNLDWTILYPLLAGVFDITALFFLIKSLKNEKLGLSIAVASTYPVVVTLFSILFLGEKLNIIQIFSIFSILFGIFLTSLVSLNFKKVILNKNLKFAFFSLFFWAIDLIFLKLSSNYYSEIESTIFLGFGGFLAIFIFGIFFIKKKELKEIDKKNIFITFLIALLFTTGAYFLNSAFEKTSAGIVSAILGSSALITTLISIMFYKEKFSKHQYFGMFIIIISLFFLNFFG